jgi:hypothetical protein
MKQPMKPRLAIKRRILIVTLCFPGLSLLYILLLCFPDPLFAYEFKSGPIVIRSDQPIPATAESVLRESQRRLTRSPFFDPSVERRVYVCNRPWRFVLFANIRYRAGGLTHPPLSNNIFLRAADFDENRLISPSGIRVPGLRDLSYFIAHEVAHTMIADRVGSIAYVKLAAWKDEGYSDYIAKGGVFSFDDELRKLRAGDPELDPARSGLYLRYHLLVAYLLDRKGASPQDLLEKDFDSSTIEREMVTGQGPLPSLP